MGLSNFGVQTGKYVGAALLRSIGGVEPPMFANIELLVLIRSCCRALPILLIPLLVPTGSPGDAAKAAQAEPGAGPPGPEPEPEPVWPPVKGSAAEYEDHQLEPPQWVEVTVVKVDHGCAPPAYIVKLPGGNERSTELSRLRRVGEPGHEPEPEQEHKPELEPEPQRLPESGP